MKAGRHSSTRPIYVKGKEDNVEVEVAMQYNMGYQEHVFSFVNNISTRDGGTHEAGFKRAITRIFKKYGDDSGLFTKAKVANSPVKITVKD